MTSSLENQLKTHYPSIFLHWFEPCIRFLTKELTKKQILSRKQRKPHWNRQMNRRVIFGLLAQLWPMTSCIINAFNRRELANCSIKFFLYRTTFGNDHLQLAENIENDWKFASSKRKCDQPLPWKTVTMQRKKKKKKKKKKIALFSNFSDKKSNREVVSKAWESTYFSNTIWRSGNGHKIRRITIYGGELTGMVIEEKKFKKLNQRDLD